MAGVRYQAIIQVKQLGTRSVLGWVTADSPSPYRKVEREVIFFSHYRLRTDYVKWPTVSTQVFRNFHERERKGKREEKAKMRWGYIKGNGHTGGTTYNKKDIEIINMKYIDLEVNFSADNVPSPSLRILPCTRPPLALVILAWRNKMHAYEAVGEG